tara:strand:+ start:799 stop:969 length:171 start_codon:yes stop_codon:yes gene_type:complete
MSEKKKEKGRQWDGISRPSNDTYAKNWQDIFGKKKEELRKSYEQSKLNKKERKNDK